MNQRILPKNIMERRPDRWRSGRPRLRCKGRSESTRYETLKRFGQTMGGVWDIAPKKKEIFYYVFLSFTVIFSLYSI